MGTLTPEERRDEVTNSAMNEGLMNGAMVMAPCLGTLYAAMQNPKFRKLTNWQSRTALVIMPTLFAFALTSEHKMYHRMHEVAEETEHAIKSVEWADQKYRATDDAAAASASSLSSSTDAMQAKAAQRELYRQSVLNSGVRVVEGSELQPFHKAANFLQGNPFKCIAMIGVPSVAYIFYGKTGKSHLSMQLKILHTRVLGQFSIICTLLGIMALKDMMDKSGRYITEAEVESRVVEMEKTRDGMLERLEYMASQQAQQAARKKY